MTSCVLISKQMFFGAADSLLLQHSSFMMFQMLSMLILWRVLSVISSVSSFSVTNLCCICGQCAMTPLLLMPSPFPGVLSLSGKRLTQTDLTINQFHGSLKWGRYCRRIDHFLLPLTISWARLWLPAECNSLGTTCHTEPHPTHLM